MRFLRVFNRSEQISKVVFRVEDEFSLGTIVTTVEYVFFSEKFPLIKHPEPEKRGFEEVTFFSLSSRSIARIHFILRYESTAMATRAWHIRCTRQKQGFAISTDKDFNMGTEVIHERSTRWRSTARRFHLETPCNETASARKMCELFYEENPRRIYNKLADANQAPAGSRIQVGIRVF